MGESTMTSASIWIVGDLRSKRTWDDSLKVMAKAASLSHEAGATRLMLLMGAPGQGSAGGDAIDLTACISVDEAATESLRHGADGEIGREAGLNSALRANLDRKSASPAMYATLSGLGSGRLPHPGWRCAYPGLWYATPSSLDPRR